MKINFFINFIFHKDLIMTQSNQSCSKHFFKVRKLRKYQFMDFCLLVANSRIY